MIRLPKPKEEEGAPAPQRPEIERVTAGDTSRHQPTIEYIVTINDVDPAYLEEVKAEMKTRGAPLLRAILDETQGVIVALEGSHRIAAALDLGLVPTMQLVDEEDQLSCQELGYDDCGWFGGEPARAIEIRDRIAAPNGTYAGCVFRKVDAGAITLAGPGDELGGNDRSSGYICGPSPF
ncbi:MULTISPECIES: hypothetical protein [unclassified Xanthobacter]|uniref:hypothetical protein n=1 Tax=unclassified Xanthobacter TaxID=2623496 RepID=UPI001F2BE34A|nr:MULTISPECIES: hypothetical protein [unclassified Xanthobacter]